ncbi:MAG: phasin family protein [Sphingomonas adhaesiva]|uniref:phasin family protein n=1 Tax=Sphingomonas adhaesiva TaxID=28212 RepID=UPI002FFCF07C
MADHREPIAPKVAGAGSNGAGSSGKGKVRVAAPRATRVRVTPPPPAVATPVASAPVAADMTTDPTPLAAKDEIMNETVTNIADKAQDQARTMFAQANEQTRSTMEKGKKVAEDMAEFGKGNVEAIVESARIAAKGIESFGKDSAAFARARYESTAETVRAMASVKSPTELMQLQADYVRSAFDAIVAEASRSTEASLKLAGEIAAPLQNRLAIATDKIKAAA